MDKPNKFSIKIKDDYIDLTTWGKLEPEDLSAPTDAALALLEERKIDKLLDDIRQIDPDGASIDIQVKSMSILWKLQKFHKVAIVFKDSSIGAFFLSRLQSLDLDLTGKFKAFRNKNEAVKWLQQR